MLIHWILEVFSGCPKLPPSFGEAPSLDFGGGDSWPEPLSPLSVNCFTESPQLSNSPLTAP